MTCDCGSAPHKVWCAERRAIREERLAGAVRGSPRKSAMSLREERRAAHADGWARILGDNERLGRVSTARCGA